jgi:hypothetical protein
VATTKSIITAAIPNFTLLAIRISLRYRMLTHEAVICITWLPFGTFLHLAVAFKTDF